MNPNGVRERLQRVLLRNCRGPNMISTHRSALCDSAPKTAYPLRAYQVCNASASRAVSGTSGFRPGYHSVTNSRQLSATTTPDSAAKSASLKHSFKAILADSRSAPRCVLARNSTAGLPLASAS